MDLSVTGPLNPVGFTGQQHDLLHRDLPLQAVKIIKGVPVPGRFQQFKFLFPGPDTGFFKTLPGNGLAAGLPCLGGAAGIFPGAGKGLTLGPAGQKELAMSVIYPNTYNQSVFTGTPGGSPLVELTGPVTVFIINIIEFQGILLLSSFFKVQSSTRVHKRQY